MAMVALNAPRTKVVPADSLEARWMVNEDEAEEYIRDAKKHPKMQALMERQAEDRLADEERSKARAARVAAYFAERSPARGEIL